MRRKSLCRGGTNVWFCRHYGCSNERTSKKTNGKSISKRKDYFLTMRIIYKKYLPKEDIPVYDFVRKRKLVKYYTRETMAAVVCTGLLLKGQEVSEETPFFFSNSESEMMDYYRDACIAFDQK